ncbi:MAG: hypothetical protein HYZ58_04220 [Acidobacteria bacterium]|nr:hypothetical protein [Acidobacteriota bacterium]
MNGRLALVASWLIVCLAVGRSAQAQGAGAPAPARVEVSASFGVDGGTKFGDRDATLTANGAGRTADSFVLFRTSTQMRRAGVVSGRLAIALGRGLAVEGAMSLNRPSVVTTVQSDVERSGTTFMLDQRLSRYSFEGSVLLHLRALRFAGGRGLPFVDAGGAYLRDVDDGHALIESGRSFHAGAGVKYYFLARRDRFLKAAGLRVQGRMEMISRGFNPAGKARRRGGGAAGVFFGF